MAKSTSRGPLARPQQQPHPLPVVVDLPLVPEVEKPQKVAVSWWRQCPLCYTGFGGVGTATTTQSMKRYYRCQECGWTWHVKLDVVRSVQYVQLTVPTLESD